MASHHLSVQEPGRVRLRVADFGLLAEHGRFTDHGRTELIDGVLYHTNAHFMLHARATTRLMVALAIRLEEMGSALEVLSPVSVHVTEHDMPAPDIVLTSWRGDGAVPVETVPLIVEVAEETLDIDLGRKANLYAKAGVAEYWVVDLAERRVLMHEHPEADGYRGQLDLLFGEPLISATIDGLELAPDTLLD